MKKEEAWNQETGDEYPRQRRHDGAAWSVSEDLKGAWRGERAERDCCNQIAHSKD